MSQNRDVTRAIGYLHGDGLVRVAKLWVLLGIKLEVTDDEVCAIQNHYDYSQPETNSKRVNEISLSQRSLLSKAIQISTNGQHCIICFLGITSSYS